MSYDNISEVEMNKLTELDLLEPFGESSSYIIVIYQTKILSFQVKEVLRKKSINVWKVN